MYVILYVRSIVFIINAAFLYINWARLIVLYYLLEKKEPSYISQTLYVCYVYIISLNKDGIVIKALFDANHLQK